MANLSARDDLDEFLDDEEFEEESYDGDEAQSVVSDSRARRKRNRGEEVVTVTTEKKGRPTPGRRTSSTAKVAAKVGVERVPVIGGIVDYFRGVYAEMQKVTWPTREETISLTQLVLAVTVIFSISLGLVDTFYSWWFKSALEDNPGLFLLIALAVAAVTGGVAWYIFYRKDDAIPY